MPTCCVNLSVQLSSDKVPTNRSVILDVDLKYGNLRRPFGDDFFSSNQGGRLDPPLLAES